jgi:NAD(P) transhydrogenase subunit beta
MTEFLTSDQLPGLVQAAYIIAAILFVVALAGLSKHESAMLGNVCGMVGMTIALVATLALAARQATLPDPGDQWRSWPITLLTVLAAMAVGGAIGAWRARTVEMTGMPQLIAMLHSFVGLAAVFVGYNSFLEPGSATHGAMGTIHAAEVFLGTFIGAVTFTGSIVAYLKLSAKVKSAGPDGVVHPRRQRPAGTPAGRDDRSGIGARLPPGRRHRRW